MTRKLDSRCLQNTPIYIAQCRKVRKGIRTIKRKKKWRIFVKADGMVGRDLGHRRGTIYLAVHRVVGLEARPRSARSPYVTDADRLGGSRSVRACERCDVAGDVARLTQTRLSLEAERPSCGRLYCFFRKYTPSRRARLSVNHLAPRRRGVLVLLLSLSLSCHHSPTPL